LVLECLIRYTTFFFNCLIWGQRINGSESKKTWIAKLGETTQPSVKDFIKSIHGGDANKNGWAILLGLLGPHYASPTNDDGWFATDYVMAHHIYNEVGGEQTWLSLVDLVKEAEVGPYLWGYPKKSKTDVFTKGNVSYAI
jgi:hypothetical protein